MNNTEASEEEFTPEELDWLIERDGKLTRQVKIPQALSTFESCILSLEKEIELYKKQLKKANTQKKKPNTSSEFYVSTRAKIKALEDMVKIYTGYINQIVGNVYATQQIVIKKEKENAS